MCAQVTPHTKLDSHMTRTRALFVFVVHTMHATSGGAVPGAEFRVMPVAILSEYELKATFTKLSLRVEYAGMSSDMTRTQKHALWPPARATYSISGWLGSGTFGAVFKARRRSTHDNRSRSSSVAVKVIPRYSYASSRELEVMQILREKPHVAVMQLIECFSVASTEGSAARILTCLVLPLYDSCA